MKIEAIDITLNETPGNVAYYRLPDALRDFLLLCQKTHGIVGFTWDSEDPRLFGVIIKPGASN